MFNVFTLTKNAAVVWTVARLYIKSTVAATSRGRDKYYVSDDGSADMSGKGLWGKCPRLKKSKIPQKKIIDVNPLVHFFK